MVKKKKREAASDSQTTQKLSLSQVAAIVDNSGLAEAIAHRVMPEEIDNVELAVLWVDCQTLIERIKRIIDAVPFEEDL